MPKLAENIPHTAPAALGPALVERLRRICGDEHVLTESIQLRTYESDGLLQYRVTPGAVVLPADAAQVRDVVRACSDAGVPWVARGAGSGLSGGALPVQEGVLIAVTRMRRVLEIDLENGRIVVEPGVTNTEVSLAVGPTHFYPPDPSSQIVCSIGGNVAENSGGAHCFKYGFTTNYVTGLEVVLADGQVVQLGGHEVDVPGYDLLGAFVGSEGTLGICTQITLRVVPKPETVKTMVAFFETTAAAGETVSEIVSGGVVPGAIEMMDNLTIQAAEQAVGAGFPTDAGAALIVELDGSLAECDACFDDVVAVCERNGATSIRIAEDDVERALIWRTRKAAFAAMGRLAPNYFVQDGVIPRTKLPEVLAQIAALSEEYGMRVANVFHAGDGNLHPLVLYDGEAQAEKAEELAGMIVKACVDAGGSITGEHGVGVDKKHYMPSMFDEPDLAAFQHLRCAFDPRGLANPGKVMPTPRLCGEVPGPYRVHPLERDGIAERFSRAQAVRSQTPETAQAAAALLQDCAAAGVGVRIAGGGTKSWGSPGADCGVELRTAALDAIVEHNVGDFTAVVQPGVTLRELDERFAASGQMLALDPPFGEGDGATIGGTIATGDCGPLRHRYGAARDLALGVTVALSDGSLASAGGKVIKNVAGYDLSKLYSGSFGTLGLITEIAVRLHPVAPAQATATGTTDDPGILQRAAIALASSSLEAQALDVRWEAHSGSVLARFGGIAAVEQAAAAERVLAQLGVEAASTQEDDDLWAQQRAAQRSVAGGAVVRVSGRPTGLADACVAAQIAGATLVGRAALGLWWVGLPASAPGDLVTAIARMRKVLAPSPCVVLDAPSYVRAHLDPWDHVEDPAVVLMRRVKQRFDPTCTCNPGIFVGGI